jgi:hypothetical protein
VSRQQPVHPRFAVLEIQGAQGLILVGDDQQGGQRKSAPIKL